MAIHDFCVGLGPDFVMSQGKVIYRHSAKIEFAFYSGSKTLLMVSDRSLFSLMAQIKEKLIVIGCHNQPSFIGTEIWPLTFETQGTHGNARIVCMFPTAMNTTQRATLVQYIRTVLL